MLSAIVFFFFFFKARMPKVTETLFEYRPLRAYIHLVKGPEQITVAMPFEASQWFLYM